MEAMEDSEVFSPLLEGESTGSVTWDRSETLFGIRMPDPTEVVPGNGASFFSTTETGCETSSFLGGGSFFLFINNPLI